MDHETNLSSLISRIEESIRKSGLTEEEIMDSLDSIFPSLPKGSPFIVESMTGKRQLRLSELDYIARASDPKGLYISPQKTWMMSEVRTLKKNRYLEQGANTSMPSRFTATKRGLDALDYAKSMLPAKQPLGTKDPEKSYNYPAAVVKRKRPNSPS